MNDSASKVALITGAAAGIGQRVVQTLLEEDCIVAMLDRDSALLEQSGGRLNSEKQHKENFKRFPRRDRMRFATVVVHLG